MSWTSVLSAVAPETVLAVDDGGETLSYGQASRAVEACREGWGEERRLIVLLCENTCRHLEAYLALTGAGHAVILLGAGTDPAAVAALAETYRVDLVLAPDEAWLRTPPPVNPERALHPDLSVLLSTSGSTGSPKLVRFSLEQLNANARSVADYLGLSAEERPLAHLPFHYSFGLSVVHSHLVAGATLLLTRHSLMSPDFWRRLGDEAATSLAGVPFHFEMLLRLRIERKAPPSLRTLAQAGGRLAPELVSKVADIAAQQGWRFFVMYGQTEAGPRLSYLPPERVAAKPGAIGQAIPGVRLSLVQDGVEGSEGELQVESPSVMMGYAEGWSDLALGDVRHGRLSTGDLARRDADGDLTIVGRKSRFIKLQGNRVNLADVEHRLSERGFPVVCVGEDDRLWVVTEDDVVDPVRQAVIDSFTFPSRSVEVTRVAQVPRSDGGKVRYAALLAAMKGEEAAS